MSESRARNRQVLKGTVVSTAMDRTAVVEVQTVSAHPVYRKRHRTSRKYYVHDEENMCNVGDLVRIAETRPLSKTKRWRLLEVVEKAR
ncbi:30S ribosomal protein S17 [Candidatus Fermentibacterales bacterium]|nr:30S ribosomal protein S17 [Candidatus Fermentibacterales bacterium]